MSRSVSVCWIGVASGDTPRTLAIRACLDEIYIHQGHRTWNELWLSTHINGKVQVDEERLTSQLRALCRCNPNLLEMNESGCRLKISSDSLYDLSFDSLYRKFEDDLLPASLHRPEPTQSPVYCLGWRPQAKRFQSVYYEAWKILSSRATLAICADLLIRRAHIELGENLQSAIESQPVTHILSITPSAGLLGREIARTLSLDFYEAPSIYSLSSEDWFPVQIGESVLIVDDVFGTGKTTNAILETIKDRKARCIAVLALMCSRTREDRKASDPPLIIGVEIDCGVPEPEVLVRAIDSSNYFEIDPHSLEPFHKDSLRNYNLENPGKIRELGERLSLMATSSAIMAGHFVQGDHHYDYYFSLPNLLANTALRASALEWIATNIQGAIAERDHITIVYPYYSPIHILVAQLEDDPALIGLDSGRVSFVVAKPVQRSCERLRYLVNIYHLQAGTVFFLDDGIGTGSTLDSIIEQILDQQEVGITTFVALVFFSRLAYYPIKHYERLNTLTGHFGKIRFSFHPYVSINYPAWKRGTCPQCHIRRSLEALKNTNGVWSECIEKLEDVFQYERVPDRALLRDSYLGQDDIYQVAVFRHAVFADLPTGHTISVALRKDEKSPLVRAECLTTLLCDSKLYRQISCIEDCSILIRNSFNEILDLASPPESRRKSYPQYDDIDDLQDRSKLARSRFVSYVLHWVDREAAVEFIYTTPPEVYWSYIIDPCKERGENLDAFFGKNLLEFAAIALATHNVSCTAPDRTQCNLDNWDRVFPAGSVYLFEMKQAACPHRQSFDASHFLFNSFVGSYKRHSDSYNSMIQNFLYYRSAPVSAAAMFTQSNLTRLLTLIDDVQSNFEMSYFSYVDFDRIREVYMRHTTGLSATGECDDRIKESGCAEVYSLFTKHFREYTPPNTTIFEEPHSTIVNMLLAIVPALSDIEAGAGGVLFSVNRLGFRRAD